MAARVLFIQLYVYNMNGFFSSFATICMHYAVILFTIEFLFWLNFMVDSNKSILKAVFQAKPEG